MFRYHVADMTCGHCVQSITAAIQGAEPSAQVEVDLASKSVKVTGATSPVAVENAIRDAGYTPAAAGASCCGHC